MSEAQPPVEVEIADDPAAWDRFVHSTPGAGYGHRFGWKGVVERAYRRRSVFLAARRAGELVGVLPAVWLPGRLAGARLVSMPYLDLGGPLAESSDVRRALLEALGERAEGLGARAVELRGDRPIEGAEGDRFRFLLELPDDAGRLWDRLGGKVRNQIRKADKSGLTTHRADVERLPDFYGVFARNMRDLGSPVHSLRFLEAVLEQFEDDAHLYLTVDATGRAIAGAIGLSFGQALAVPWASALREARPLCPNHSLYWHILESAISTGFREFDFGRSTLDTGTYRFKQHWGATPRALGWTVIEDGVTRPAASGRRSRPAGILTALWSRLPLAVANLLGPHVRGRLPQ